jgi:hypothetical protein
MMTHTQTDRDKSFFERVADLPLDIEDYDLDHIERDTSGGSHSYDVRHVVARQRTDGPQRGRHLLKTVMFRFDGVSNGNTTRGIHP